MLNLWKAPFQTPLLVEGFTDMDNEVQSVLVQLGIEPGEQIEKIHSAPLGDPIAIKIGEHLFTLRSEICQKIQVKKL
jgi:Fe2+ transport system protein FeoA